MKIYLVRHGETDWNLEKRLMGQKEIPLNAHGREQAAELKNKLQDINFDICFSSPLTRAKETAEIICKEKVPITFDKNLLERNIGELEGKTVDDIKYFYNNKTVETDEEMLSRAKNFLEKLKNSNYKTVLVVSHNGLLKNLRHCLLKKSGSVDYSESANFKNCDFEVFDYFDK